MFEPDRCIGPVEACAENTEVFGVRQELPCRTRDCGRALSQRYLARTIESTEKSEVTRVERSH